MVSQTTRSLPSVQADVHVLLIDHPGQVPIADAVVVALLRGASEDDRARACSAGAAAALDVDTCPDEVAQVVRLVAQGHRVVPPTCRVLPPVAPLETLTPRQLQVLAVLRSGRTQRAAAHHLGLNIGTIKKRLRDSRRLLGIANTHELLAWFRLASAASPAVAAAPPAVDVAAAESARSCAPRGRTPARAPARKRPSATLLAAGLPT